MRRIIILSFVFAVFTGISSAELSLWATDNLFKSSEYNQDIGLAVSADKTVIPADFLKLSGSLGIDIPFVNYTMINIPLSASMRFRHVNNPQFKFHTTVYDYNYLYISDYAENTALFPGIYTEAVINVYDFLTVSSLTDIFFNLHPIAEGINSSVISEDISLMIFMPYLSVHNNINGGMKRYFTGQKAWKWSYNLHISSSITRQSGIFGGFRTGFLFSDSQPYYSDDSFIDRYFYDGYEGYCGLTLQGIVGIRTSIRAFYEYRDYAVFDEMEDTPDFTDIPVDFDNSEREDRIMGFEARQSVNINKKYMEFIYTYENSISTNPFYTYHSHSFTVSHIF
ncbi:MAG: hypothetical protein R6U31_02825 [bacterium]